MFGDPLEDHSSVLWLLHLVMTWAKKRGIFPYADLADSLRLQ